MYIEQLEIYGFKSFAVRTELRFGKGLNIIIGPNGCGKSNIFDAIRWVIGEQRLSLLRSSLLEHFIFKGSAAFKPLNFAEVSIEFAEARGLLPFDPSCDKVRITRRAYRDGGSQFFINGMPVRLKDVKSILAGVGLADISYAVMEQSMVQRVLSSSVADRRSLFEQAAGIARYKLDRNATQLKLNETQSDLMRLEDIIREVQEQEAILRRQVKKTRQYRKLLEQKEQLFARLVFGRIKHLENEKEKIQSELRDKNDELGKLRSSISSLRARVQSKRAKMDELSRERSNILDEISRVRKDIADSESKIKVLEERIRNAEAQLVSANEKKPRLLKQIEQSKTTIAEQREFIRKLDANLSEIDAEQSKVQQEAAKVNDSILKMRRKLREDEEKYSQLRQRLAQLENEIGFAKDELAKLDAEEKSMKGEIGNLNAKLADAQHEIADGTRRVEEVDGQIGEIEAQKETLKERIATLEAEINQHSQSLNELRRKKAELSGKLDAVKANIKSISSLDKLDKSDEANKRQEGRIKGIVADFIQTENPQVLEAVLGEKLKFIVVENADDAQKVYEDNSESGDKYGFVILSELSDEGELPDWIKLTEPRLGALIGKIKIGDTIDKPMEGEVVVTKDGKKVRKMGEYVFRSGEVKGILTQKMLLGKLENELEKLGSREKELERKLSSLRVELNKAVEKVSVLASKADELMGERKDVEGRIRSFEMLCEEWRQQKKALENKIDQLKTRRENLREKLSVNEALVSKIRDEIDQLSETVENGRKEITELERQSRELESKLSALEIKRLSTENDIKNAQTEIQRQELAIKQANSELMALEAQIEEAKRTKESSKGEIKRTSENLKSLFSAETELQEKLASLDAKIGEMDSEIKGLTEKEREFETKREELSSKLTELEHYMGTLSGMLDELYRERNKLSVELEEAEPLDDERAKEMQQRLERLERRIEQMGGVNLEAEEQYESVSRRLNFLKEQESDIKKSIMDLKRTIEHLDSEARRLFVETFEATRENFQQVFQELFEGGEGDIVLDKPDDPLESDILIKVRPTGKRFLNLSQLSTGEKALTALALLFSLYLVRPAPFCLMDEVDAPLDDANIRRFLSLINRFKERIQFIVITHNKLTIKEADYLYGVSMEQDGVSRVISVRMREFVGA